MVGFVLPSSMQSRPVWRSLLPPGFESFDPAQPCGYWPSLWQRWIGYRQADPAFADFLTFLEALPRQPTLTQAQLIEELPLYLQAPRNRFFLFLLWFFREGPQPTPLASLPDLAPLLGPAYWSDFLRWHRKYHADFRVLQCLQAWQRQPGVQAACNYKGVDLGAVMDYQAVPQLLHVLFNAFMAE
ncbi:hypothetical protein [Pseudomonas oryzihabitans]|uniref:hypothetical protein n=1 Tax=Pseudomonas oryzihabitans TaxID=47885 RepID=UPI0005A9B76E|nr:hypothetical protein [Pseudomonas oryzihabitans]NMZ44360.1 hypothetical protein [Pseudomonas oryzihabitans]